MSVTLQWEPPTDNGGRPVLGYVIEMKDKFTADWIEVMIFKTKLFLHSIPSRVIRENGVPNTKASAYLFCFVHCQQSLHTCPPQDPHAFYLTFPSIFNTVFEGQSGSPHPLPLTFPL